MQWIAFDAVGTLIYPDPPAHEVYYRAAQRHGSRLSRDEITVRFRRAFGESERNRPGAASRDADHRFLTNESVETEKWRWIVGQVIDDAADGDACFTELFRHFAVPDSWKCFAEVPAVLAALGAVGRRVALASNFDARLHAICEGLPVLRSIELRVVSSEVGWRKPSARFYDALVQRAGCERREMLMVGDDYDNDVAGARAAGLAAVWLNRNSAGESLLEISNLGQLPAAIAGFEWVHRLGGSRDR